MSKTASMLPATRDPTTFQCHVCYSTFSTNSHLRRHEAIHTGQRSVACPFCNRGFFRRDAARRHAKSCTFRRNRPLPEPKRGGRKKHSCDSCARGKRGCDRDFPCESCLANDLVCSYRRSESKPEQKLITPGVSDTPFESGFSSTPDPTIYDPPSIFEAQNGHWYPRMRVRFLLEYTKPGRETLPDFFGASTGTTTPALSFPTSRSMAPLPKDFMHDFEGSLQGSQSPTLEFLLDDIVEGQLLEPILDSDELSGRLTELKDQLKLTRESLSTRYGVASQEADAEEIEMLFTVENLIDFTGLYFQNWHPNCPILHQPTFNLETISLPLLLSVLLIGATYSAPRDTASMARQFYDIAEEYAFGHKDFTRILQTESTLVGEENAAVEALQAAFLSVVMQNWTNSTISRRRMRTQRYSEIVSAARLLGLTSATNEWTRKERCDISTLDWTLYTKAEERVRLMCYIFLVDCQYTIFYRYPPRLMITEMSSDLPASDEAFSADSDLLCAKFLSDSCHSSNISLSKCLRTILEKDWDPENEVQLGTLSTLNLFTIINALNSMIFTAKANFPGTQNLEPVRIALIRWNRIWDHHLQLVNPQTFKKIGFMKNAVEFFHLTNIFLDPDVGQDRYGTSGNVDTDSMAEINGLLERFENITIE